MNRLLSPLSLVLRSIPSAFSVFLEFAAKGQLSLLEQAIADGIDPNTSDNKGQTALHISAAHGHAGCCEALLLAGAKLFAIDHRGNTAYHIAAQNNQTLVLRVLYDAGHRYALLVSSNDVCLVEDRTFSTIIQHVFELVPLDKLLVIDTPRYEKIWLMDGYIKLRTLLSPAPAYFDLTAPADADVIDYVLRTFDPRPETGIFVSNPLYNPLKPDDIMKFVPTVATAQDLEKLLSQCLRMCALDVRNGLFRRSPLQVACDSNTVDSHMPAITFLLRECGCNVSLTDKNGKTAMDLLVQDKNNVPSAPTASRVAEELLLDKRDAYFAGVAEESAMQAAAALELRRAALLEECGVLALTESAPLWDAYRNAAMVVQSFPRWTKFRDSETQNVFYGHKDAAEGGVASTDVVVAGQLDLNFGDIYDQFSWQLPIEAVEVTVIESITFSCAARSSFLRSIGKWDMLRSHDIDSVLYLNREDSAAWSFDIPTEIEWSVLLKTAKVMAKHGFYQEWTSMEDAYGNAFYYNALMNVTCWDRPLDAVDEPLKSQLCTSHYIDRNIEQRIFTCDDCKIKSKASSKGVGLRICEACATRCHWSHKGVRLIRTGFAKCSCSRLQELIGNVCVACVSSKTQAEAKKAAVLIDSEAVRCRLVDLLMPPIVAFVPRNDPCGEQQPESGWRVCRRAPTTASHAKAVEYCTQQTGAAPFLDLLSEFAIRTSSIDVPQHCILVMNPVEPVVLAEGDLVLCRLESPLKEYGHIKSCLKLNVYSVLLSSGRYRKLHRSRMNKVDTDVFLFHDKSRLSSWNASGFDPIASSVLKLTGGGWEDVKQQGHFRRYFKDFDEYLDMYSGQLFYYNIQIGDQESAARTIQRLIRQKLALCYPLAWQSKAHSFEKPVEVANEERVFLAWANLRRRSSSMGFFVDVHKIDWEEYLDPTSNMHFFWSPITREYTWTKPDVPVTKDDSDPLALGDAVLYRFKEKGPEETCLVTKCRTDDETGEDMYDICHAEKKNRCVKWVPRIALKRVPETLEEAELRRYEAMWITQIRRQRAAEGRQKQVKKEVKTYFTLDIVQTSDRDLAPNELQRRASARQYLAVQEELVAREAEAVRKEASRQHTLKAALVEKIDPTTMSRSEIIRVERATALVVKIQERVKERQQEADSQQAERDRQDEETRLQEEELRRMEQGTSTPRSLRRRKVVRELDRAVRRQERGQFVCEYGCKDWIASRSARDEHRSRACRLRQVYCTFECGLHMREDEWLADNYQLTHECEECPNRLVYCPLNCLEWVLAKDLDHHTTVLCPKRPGKLLACRLGCDALFGGTIEEQLDAEDARYTHELDECEYRLVKCSWTYGAGKSCGAMIRAIDRDAHREWHIVEMGVSVFRTPGTYAYKVPEKVSFVKVQVWGAGGGSGCFKGRRSGAGGGAAFVEAILNVKPRDVLEVVVGEGGKPGSYSVDKTNPDTDAEQFTLGTGSGGEPGGGVGYSGNDCFACGGGGAYSVVSKRTPQGLEILMIAGGGGGGGSLDGVPGVGISGILPGTKINRINGGQGGDAAGGVPGESGGVMNSSWAATAGTYYVGGNGSEFGAGGGGGFFGGGGGGTLPGIAGGGGGGSSYVNMQCVRDVVSIGGSAHLPGGITHGVPEAVGAGDWDKVGGVAGEGGHTSRDGETTRAGKNGAVRILKPGFY